MADSIYIGFDLGGTKMLAGAFDESFKLLGVEKRRTRSKDATEALDEKAGFKRIVETIDELLENLKISRKQIKGIGIGVPGPVDMDEGVLVEAVNLGWKDLPLRKLLDKEYDCQVQVGNDVDFGVYGEYLEGAGKGAKVLLGASPGTGLGGGLVVRGDIYRGARLSCMEIGHVRFQTHGAPCGCGQRGCLETLTSRLAIARECVVELFRGNAPTLDGLTGHSADIRLLKGGVLAESAKSDEAVEESVKKAMKWLGVGLAGMVNVLGPDRIVIGGGLVESMPDLVLDRIRETTRKAVMKAYRDSYEIVAAKLGDDAVITGGAGLARQNDKKRS